MVLIEIINLLSFCSLMLIFIIISIELLFKMNTNEKDTNQTRGSKMKESKSSKRTKKGEKGDPPMHYKKKKSDCTIIKSGQKTDVKVRIYSKSTTAVSHRYCSEFSDGIDMNIDPMKVALEMYEQWWHSKPKGRQVLKDKVQKYVKDHFQWVLSSCSDKEIADQTMIPQACHFEKWMLKIYKCPISKYNRLVSEGKVAAQ